jgi:hypothetical protein
VFISIALNRDSVRCEFDRTREYASDGPAEAASSISETLGANTVGHELNAAISSTLSPAEPMRNERLGTQLFDQQLEIGE